MHTTDEIMLWEEVHDLDDSVLDEAEWERPCQPDWSRLVISGVGPTRTLILVAVPTIAADD